MYKDPGCECCARWCKHLAANGFVVQTRDTPNMDDIKRTMNVPSELQSCHTAVVGRYIVEGHVPADLVKKMLAEKPQIWSPIGIRGIGLGLGASGGDPYDLHPDGDRLAIRADQIGQNAFVLISNFSEFMKTIGRSR